jgi:hypothetical protein
MEAEETIKLLHGEKQGKVSLDIVIFVLAIKVMT